MTPLKEVVKYIHATPHRGSLYITGGGAGAIGKLLRHGGGSATMVYGNLVYPREGLVKFLGKNRNTKNGFWPCREYTARAMAMQAFQDSAQLLGTYDNIFGVGVTASLVKEGGVEREGREHRIFIAIQTATCTQIRSFQPSLMVREDEEDLTDELIIREIAWFLRRSINRYTIDLVERRHGEDEQAWESRKEFLRGYDGNPGWLNPRNSRLELGAVYQTACLQSSANKQMTANFAKFWTQEGDDWRKCHLLTTGMGPKYLPGFIPTVRAIQPGSFNPEHDGHREMRRYAAERLKVKVYPEISLLNADKPALDFVELVTRWRCSSPDAVAADNGELGEPDRTIGDLLVTNTPYLVDKAKLFPGAVFLQGIDTWKRVLNPKYYGGSTEAMLKAMVDIANLECKVMVFGRVTAEGEFEGYQPPEDPLLRAIVESLVIPVSEEEFRLDISSTELRLKNS